MTDLRELIEQEIDQCLEWPTADKSHVTTVSAMLFAKHVATLYADHVADSGKMAAPVVQGDPVAGGPLHPSQARTLRRNVQRNCPPEIHALLERTIAAPQPAPDVAGLVEALEQIERWDGFPSTNKTWEGSGEPVSYGAAFGSNGERDFMREVARKALAAHRKQGGEA